MDLSMDLSMDLGNSLDIGLVNGFSDDIGRPLLSPGEGGHYFQPDSDGIFTTLNSYDPFRAVGASGNNSRNSVGGTRNHFHSSLPNLSLPSFPQAFGRQNTLGLPTPFLLPAVSFIPPPYRVDLFSDPVPTTPVTPASQQQRQQHQLHYGIANAAPQSAAAFRTNPSSSDRIQSQRQSQTQNQRRHQHQHQWDNLLDPDSFSPLAPNLNPTNNHNSTCLFAPLRQNRFRTHTHSSSLNPNSTSNIHIHRIQTSHLPQYSAQQSTPTTGSTHHQLNNISPSSSSQEFLAALAGDFSSHSLRGINRSPSLPSPCRPESTTATATSTNLTDSQTLGIADSMPPAELRTAASTRSRRYSTVSRSSTADQIDLTKEDRDSSSPAIDLMPPPSRKRTRTAANLTNPSATASSSSAGTNRRRPLTTATAARPIKQPTRPSIRPVSRDHDDSPFDSDPLKKEVECVDLSKADDVPQELLKPKVDNRVKLTSYNCSICMDDVTNLTVTHCGHMFCSECLHSALHIDPIKKSCPICRTKVEVKSKTGPNPKKFDQRTFYHLELKLMTANRKGKQAAR